MVRPHLSLKDTAFICPLPSLLCQPPPLMRPIPGTELNWQQKQSSCLSDRAPHMSGCWSTSRRPRLGGHGGLAVLHLCGAHKHLGGVVGGCLPSQAHIGMKQDNTGHQTPKIQSRKQIKCKRVENISHAKTMPGMERKRLDWCQRQQTLQTFHLLASLDWKHEARLLVPLNHIVAETIPAHKKHLINWDKNSNFSAALKWAEIVCVYFLQF